MKNDWDKFENLFGGENEPSRRLQLQFMIEYSLSKINIQVKLNNLNQQEKQEVFLNFFEFVLYEHLKEKIISQMTLNFPDFNQFWIFYEVIFNNCFDEATQVCNDIIQNHSSWKIFNNIYNTVKHWRKHSIAEIFIKNIKLENQISSCFEYFEDANNFIEIGNEDPDDVSQNKQAYFTFDNNQPLIRIGHLKKSVVEKICCNNITNYILTTFRRDDFPSNFLWP